MIDYVIKATGYEKIDYIGHSQGATQMLYALSKD
jgi:pimeloyl-ACP methyl ester carboxylesterase